MYLNSTLMSVLAPTAPTALSELFNKHRHLLDTAAEALFKRDYYTPYPEHPKAYSPEAADAGLQRFEHQRGKSFDRLHQEHDSLTGAEEESPYTREQLGVTYPAFDEPVRYIAHAAQAAEEWGELSVEARTAVLIEAIERLKGAGFFEIAHATMHTTGQAYMMAFQASGPHAADRALEAVVMGYVEQTRIPGQVTWTKPMGKFDAVVHKEFVNVPNGLALAIGCSTFPTWNSVPGIFASLVTGNPVIVKPHPLSIYPIAVIVASIQDVLAEYNLNVHAVQLATDTLDAPITKQLAEAPEIKLIDYTGGSAFGDYIEGLPGKTTFTEKAGVNSVILDSVQDLKAVTQNLAMSAILYSGQMCTAPQNFFIPESGIDVAGENVPYEQVRDALVKAIGGLASHEKAGPAVCGAIQRDDTLARVAKAAELGAKVLLESKPIVNLEFPEARTTGPVVLEVSKDKAEIFGDEMFGPIAFIIPTANTDESIALASQLAAEKGAISSAAYTTNPEVQAKVARAMAKAFTPVAFNLTGHVLMNQNAAFGDFHVSGGNPAGNASFADPNFINKRYTKVGLKLEALN